MKRIMLLSSVLLAACVSVPALAAASPPPVAVAVAVPTAPTVVRAIQPSSSMRAIAPTPAYAVPTSRHRIPLGIPFGGLALIGLAGITLPRTRAMDKTAQTGLTDDVRANQSMLIDDLFYAVRNRTGTVAPVAARGGTAQKAKTTNNTTFLCGGAPIALAATDDFWTFTGGVLAVSSFRKYRLISDASAVASVQASADAATAALCDFAARPADGKTILSVVTIATDGTHTFTPATTALNATGITATFIDGSDGLEFVASKLTP